MFALEKPRSPPPPDSRGRGRHGSWELRDRAGLTENTQDIISASRKSLFNFVYRDSLQIPESSGAQTEGVRCDHDSGYHCQLEISKYFHIYF